MRTIRWYFDFVSPFAYLALQRLPEVAADIEYRPVLFAGLLAHWGQKGPAEMPTKRLWTYRYCQWLAEQLDISFRFPAQHPFNPLHHLRLAIAAGVSRKNVERIFEAIWTTGAEAADPAAFMTLAKDLGVDEAKLASPEVKETLRRNTEGAIARGVFGVPTYEADGELFWGADSLGFLNAFLADPAVLRNAEMRRVDELPVGAARKP